MTVDFRFISFRTLPSLLNVHCQTKHYETLRNERNERNDRIEPHSILPSPSRKKKEEMEDKKSIESVRECPCLWRVCSKAYKDIQAKENAWKEVAKVNKLIPGEVM